MPTYEFKCNTCGGTQEITKFLGDDTIPTCCSASMERVWSAPPVHFKAGGFYSTGG